MRDLRATVRVRPCRAWSRVAAFDAVVRPWCDTEELPLTVRAVVRASSSSLWPDNGVVADAGEEPRVFRRGGISYLRVPAAEPRRSAAFYEAVFGWRVDADRDDPSFEDGTGHVIGHFMADLPVAGEAGVLPYVFVERVDETLEKVVAHGGEVLTPPYPEGRSAGSDVPRPSGERSRRLAAGFSGLTAFAVEALLRR